MIKVLLVGYGKMGKIIKDNLGYIYGQAVKIIDNNIPEYNTPLVDLNSQEIDVAIEFTHPSSGYQNVRELLKRKIPVVTGTTGWFHKIDDLKQEFNPEEHTLIYGANFSIGMNLFFEIVKNTTNLINQTSFYDVYGLENHHRKKADAPSGTAKELADIIIKNLDGKEKAVYNLNNQALEADQLCFSSIRSGNTIGYHEIGFDSLFDEIKLIHNAKNRNGFAMGAILAAKYALNHKGFFNIKDIFKEVLINKK